MGSTRFPRDFTLRLNTVRIRGTGVDGSRQTTLRTAFRCERDTSTPSGTLEAAVYNLNATSRSAVQERNTPIVLEAGHVGNIGTIFSGQLLKGRTEWSDGTWITTLQAKDGLTPYSAARINESFAPGVTVKAVIDRVVDFMAVGRGNLDEALKAAPANGLTEFANGVVLRGRCKQKLKELLGGYGLEWSIQNGALQVLQRDAVAANTIPLLQPGTGLIGSPEPGENGRLTVKAILDAVYEPGLRVQIKTRQFEGVYKIRKVIHEGDTHEQAWTSTMECKRI